MSAAIKQMAARALVITQTGAGGGGRGGGSGLILNQPARSSASVTVTLSLCQHATGAEPLSFKPPRTTPVWLLEGSFGGLVGARLGSNGVQGSILWSRED